MRIFDIIVSGVLILILMPILLPTIFFLRITGEGEVFYLQKRVGLNCKEFDLIKFATMLKNSPDLGSGNITVKDDPRVLPFGKLLRRSKINELPQLFNIFVGDMSLVGPRPLTRDNFNYYRKEQQSIISSVKPGLSGVGSIFFRSEDELLRDQGSANEIYATLISPYKADLECWYVAHKTFFLDLILIIETVKIVLFPNGKSLYFLENKLPKPCLRLQRLIDQR